jgi:DNA topoisomerase-1
MHSLADISAMIKKEGLTPDHGRLYELIFKRAVASQMAAARYDSTVMHFTVAGERFRAAGRVLTFDGFLKVYAEVDEEKEKKGDEDTKLQLLPPVSVGELVPKLQEILDEKKTKPPGGLRSAHW